MTTLPPTRSGPLCGVKVLEVAGVGPAPFAAMMLADLGAEIIKIERAASAPGEDPSARLREVLTAASTEASGTANAAQPLDRGRNSIGVNLKDPAGVALFLDLASHADALIEGFRPGVMERLGIGPEACAAVNPRLVFGRVTGWGQDGPLSSTPGHDIDYLAVSGALEAIGPPDRPPTPPLNYLADFAGGGMLLAFGILAAVLEARTSGQGQVVDAAMLDGAALLTTVFAGMRAQGMWSDVRGANMLDGGSHFYGVYTCADGKFLALGAIEPVFYATLVEIVGLGDTEHGGHLDPAQWPRLRSEMASILLTKSRDEWCALLEGTNACVAPVLSMGEAPSHPHNVARSTFVSVDAVVQPAPAPRFARTPGRIVPAAELPSVDASLAAWGLNSERLNTLRSAHVIT